ncbi:hypothetical protein D3C84_1123020 [compost metagenome]
MFGTADLLLDFSRAFPVHGADTAAINGRMHRLCAVLVQGRVDAQAIKQCSNHGKFPHTKNKGLAAGQMRLIRPVVVAGLSLANKRPLSEISFRLFMLAMTG